MITFGIVFRFIHWKTVHETYYSLQRSSDPGCSLKKYLKKTNFHRILELWIITKSVELNGIITSSLLLELLPEFLRSLSRNSTIIMKKPPESIELL